MTGMTPISASDEPVSADPSATTRLLDRGAIGLSALCLVHCLAVPVLIAASPALAAALPDAAWVHPAILATAAPLAAVALWRGWRQHHRRGPAAFGVAGIALLAAGVAAGETTAGTLLTVSGALLLAAAHLLNWRGIHGTHRHFAPIAERHRVP